MGAAADGEEALELVADKHPDAILLDLHMPFLDGTETTRRLTAQHPTVAVVVLTTYADDSSVLAALQAGPAATSPRTPTEPTSPKPFAVLPPACPSSIPPSAMPSWLLRPGALHAPRCRENSVRILMMGNQKGGRDPFDDGPRHG